MPSRLPAAAIRWRRWTSTASPSGFPIFPPAVAPSLSLSKARNCQPSPHCATAPKANAPHVGACPASDPARRAGLVPGRSLERQAPTDEFQITESQRRTGFAATPIRRDIMALISMRQLLDHAAEYGYGVPAFNVNNLEQMRAIMEAADQTDSPVIVQASAGARKYAGAPFLRHLILAAIEEFPHIPVVMHQDHGTSPAVCQRSIQLGFSSVMMDGSLGEDGKTPTDYDYNVRVTR